MELNAYQVQARRTMTHDWGESTPVALAWNAMGLAGEAGEVVDELKKVAFHKHELDKDKLQDELGDVLWYLSAITTVLDLSLGGVAQRNIEKLRERYPDGWSEEASRNRATEPEPAQ